MIKAVVGQLKNSLGRWVNEGQTTRLLYLFLATGFYIFGVRALQTRFETEVLLLGLFPVAVAGLSLGLPTALLWVGLTTWSDSFLAGHLKLDAELWLRSSLVALALKALVGTLSGLFFSSAEQKKLLSRELEQSQWLYANLMESLGEGVALFDSQGRCVRANGQAERLFLAETGELQGQLFSKLVDWESRTDLNHRDNPDTQSGVLRYEVSTRGAQPLCLWVSETPLQQMAGRAVGGRLILRVLSDATRLRSLQSEQKTLETRLLHAQAISSLSVLAGGVAHDTANLMTGVVGNVELAKARLRTADLNAVGKHLTEIQAFAKEAGDLAKRMLDLARGRTGEATQIELKQVIREALERFAPLTRKKGQIDERFCEESISVLGQPQQIRQVLMNLMLNALEACEEGGANLVVSCGEMELSTREASFAAGGSLRAGRYGYVEVKDNGCGMAPAVLDNVLVPFFTTKVRGSGMGLPATLAILNHHGGGLLINSTEGEGSCFRALLPLATDKLQERHSTVPLSGTFRTAGRVLLIHDEPVSSKTMAKLLAQFGFDTLVTLDKGEALAKLEDGIRGLRLVVVDPDAPRLGGTWLLDEIQRLAPSVGVILWSFRSEKELGELAHHPTVEAVLSRLHSADELGRVVSAALENVKRKELHEVSEYTVQGA